ncbi:cation diffusion facilitator family transporter [Allokutzneria sp. A3M-2-11 16]|uniref:cation diffusion facilitator family transporter n=1 Tax=Allokutzneria sp. A3M-2-11 16 TaxID=2962043 RepID=UPI0020B78FA9|nr:cation diffusion facilitator family transporter [Allokutzneria sp. A3M-2-11 16]MCP3800738.1 cation diffusion facilitator family transporter [Allokutzneria sp. A3M-2-11 16]
MGHGHGHGIAANNPESASAKHLNRLYAAVALGAFTLVMQVVVGLSTSSLALLSDSAHVFTDVLGISLAVVAILVARKARSNKGRTFGMYRAEVLAALANTLLLFGVAIGVLVEAVDRLGAPPEVPGLPVTIVALIGLAANVIAFFLLRSGAKESINVRGAYLEVLADMIGSVGVLISGLVTMFFGWRYADPLIGVAIGLFVLPRAYVLGRNALRILFQHAPERVDVASVQADLLTLTGVVEVHDLHVWTLTSGMEVASAHLITEPGREHTEVLLAAQRLLTENYHIEHATLQVEPVDCATPCRELAW